MLPLSLRRTALPLSLLLTLAACAPVDLKQALEGQKPQVSVADQRLTHLDFERVNMAFGLQVDNPNPVGIKLAGLDYDLQLAGHSFATGKQDKRMKLAASGRSRFELPLSLSFKEIYQGIDKLKGMDEVPYELTTGLIIDVPLLGKLRYPVTTSGVLPLPQLPRVSLSSMHLEKLNFSSATLALNIELDNPNAFSLGLERLNYDFMVNGKRWANASRQSLGSVEKNQKSTISLPITLNFMELGSGLYSLLSSNEELNYSLNGTLDASSDNSLIGQFAMPFNTSGRVKLAQ